MNQVEAEQRLSALKLKIILHQDVFVAHGSMDDAVAALISPMTPKNRCALREAVRYVLTHCSNAELKGVLNRLGTEIAMTSKGARAFFELLANRVE